MTVQLLLNAKHTSALIVQENKCYSLPPLSFHLALTQTHTHTHTHIHSHTSVSTIPRNTPFLHHPLRAESGLALQRTGMPGARSSSHINTHKLRPCPWSNGLCEHATCSSTAASVSALICGAHAHFVCECNSSCSRLRECVFPCCAGLLTQQRVVSLCFHGLVCVCVCVASLHFICPEVSCSNKLAIARHSKVPKQCVTSSFMCVMVPSLYLKPNFMSVCQCVNTAP